MDGTGGSFGVDGAYTRKPGFPAQILSLCPGGFGEEGTAVRPENTGRWGFSFPPGDKCP